MDENYITSIDELLKFFKLKLNQDLPNPDPRLVSSPHIVSIPHVREMDFEHVQNGRLTTDSISFRDAVKIERFQRDCLKFEGKSLFFWKRIN